MIMRTATQTENPRALAFLLSEGDGTISRESVVIGAGKLVAGTVLGKVTASGQYVAHNPAATTGEQVAVAVLGYDTDATNAPQKAVAIVREAEVNALKLTFAASITADQKTAAITSLASNFIIVRGV
jgi:hypothetical protein